MAKAIWTPTIAGSGRNPVAVMELTQRIRSLFIVHLSVVFFTLGNSITFSGAWPYLKVLDDEVELSFLGVVVAMDAAAQVAFSPIFGFIADRIGRIRPIALVCSAIFILGNALYANLAMMPRDWADIKTPRVYFMVLARLVVGTGTSINAVARLYVTKVTTLEERTTHTSILSMCQSIGLICGPALASALSPLGEKVYPDETHFSFDMYTATGYVGCVTGTFVLISFMPGIFVEYNTPKLKVGEKAKKKRRRARPSVVGNGSTGALPTQNSHSPEASEGTVVSATPAISVIEEEKTDADDDDHKSRNEERQDDNKDRSKEEEESKPKKTVAIVVDDNVGEGTLSRRGPPSKLKKRELTKQYSKVSIYSGMNMAVDPIVDSKATTETTRKWPDPWAVSVLIVSFFCFFSGLVTTEVLLTPMSTNHFGWEDEEAVLYNGIFVACQGALASFCFAWIGPLSRRIDERVMMIVLGIIPLMSSRLLMIPMSSDNPPFIGNLTKCINEGYDVPAGLMPQTVDAAWHALPPSVTDAAEAAYMTPPTFYPFQAEQNPNATQRHSAAGGGCPFCWCLEARQLKVAQFMTTSIIGACGFPFCIAIAASLLSKVLGPLPQGMWMGLLTTAGGMARVVGPLVFSRIYQNNGLPIVFGTLGGLLGFSLVMNIITYKRYSVVIRRWGIYGEDSSGSEYETDEENVDDDAVATTPSPT